MPFIACFDGRCILPDDGDECICLQLISYSLLCKRFCIAVLPADKELYAEIFNTDDRRKCTLCKAAFVSGSNRAKYCPDCRVRIRRRQAAERMRKLCSHVDPLEVKYTLYFATFRARKNQGKDFIPLAL